MSKISLRRRGIMSRKCGLIARIVLAASLSSFGTLSYLGLVDAAASDALLGGEYVPTTDVGFIEDLTEVIEAIEFEPDPDKGRQFYSTFTPGSGFSLESIGANVSLTILNQTTNPLYAIYMHGYWRSANGNGFDGSHLARENMMFLDTPVDFYGNTIIKDEFGKGSGYNQTLNAETIRVTNMWMATVQSLYDGVALCHNGADNVDQLNFVSPIDKAAAFYLGTHDDVTSSVGGSLYAWASRSRDRFVSDSAFVVNDEMKNGLKELQRLLQNCLSVWDSEVTDEQEYEMNKLVNDLSRRMTVPLVQNLLYYANEVVKSQDHDPDTTDFLILYALATLPPILICDKDTFHSLYDTLVTRATELDVTSLSEVFNMLINSFTCLGVTCDQVGIPDFIIASMAVDMPVCEDTPMNAKVAGYEGTYDRLLESAVIDLDLLTIGTLVEMEANEAAMNVYWWNRYKLSLSESIDDESLNDMALAYNNEKNLIAQSYDLKFPIDDLVTNVTMGVADFGSATSSQRRQIVETLLATIVLPIYAIDSMYNGIDTCSNGGQDNQEWDKAVASFVGFLEGPEDGGTDKGTLLYDIGQFLCLVAGTCNIDNDAEVNRLLMTALKNGKQSLLDLECESAEERVNEIILYFQTILVDAVAYIASEIDKAPNDNILVANGFGVATALYPLMQFKENDASVIIMENLGTFGISLPLIDGLDVVVNALQAFIATQNIDCSLLNFINCDQSSMTPDASITTSTTTYVNVEPNPTPTESPHPLKATYFPTYLPSITARPTSSIVLGGGISASDDESASKPLLSGAYNPTSNVDHILKLISLLEDLENTDNVDAGMSLYTQEVDVGLSLQSLSTASEWNYILKVNPLFVIYMYGLWVSGDGDNDSDGYSNKKFFKQDLIEYGDTIIMNGFQKSSGYDPKLSAEAIRVMNVWMAMITELYKAVESCRDGSAMTLKPVVNPVDYAAAFWFGAAHDSDEKEDGSLHAWASRAGSNFIHQSAGVNDEMSSQLSKLQSSYVNCKNSSLTDAEELSKTMRSDVLYVTRLMTVPLVQSFINDLATKVGTGATDRDYLILHSLSLLPQIAICDEDTLDTLFTNLVTNSAEFDAADIPSTVQLIQDRLDCLGISCSLLGTSTLSDPTWPTCVDHTDPSVIVRIAGYSPRSKESSELSKIDLDVSTILSLVVMQANDAAWDIYKQGKHVFDNISGSYTSIGGLRIPQNPSVVDIYNKYSGDYGSNYLQVTESAIRGTANFVSTTPLQNSAAASLALVAMDLHLGILQNLYESVAQCRDSVDSVKIGTLWDNAVALTVGWTEGQNDFGSHTDGYLFFQLAQEVCSYFESCDSEGNSLINNELMKAFNNGTDLISLSRCDSLEQLVEAIESLLQTILIDTLAYHINSVTLDKRHYILAYVSATSLLPLMRPIDELSADILEHNVGSFPSNVYYLPDGVDTVYNALKSYIGVKGINCTLLGSSICDGFAPSDTDTSSGPKPNEAGLSLANGKYTPFTDVTAITDLSEVANKICSAEDVSSAKSVYTDDDTAGFTLQSLSLTAKNVMSNELLFNQYIYALFDEIDKTDGSLLFDGLPAAEYGNTIVSDAIEDDLSLGCLSVKVLLLWMWVVHELNQSIEECKSGDPNYYGSIDEAAAVWIGNIDIGDNKGGLLFEIAEYLGENFSQNKDSDMTTLNQKIISRLNIAQTTYFVDGSRCRTDGNAVQELRKIVKETTSYMTAVLIQGLIHSMLTEDIGATEKEAFVELYAFAFLPRIAACGHDNLYDSLYSDLVIRRFSSSLVPNVVDAIHSQLNCLGLRCEDIGRHILADGSYPSCEDNPDLVNYVPVNSTKTNMPARLDLDAVAIHQLMSLEKYNLAKQIYLSGHNYYDYDDETNFGFVSLHNLTQSSTIGSTNFPLYKMFTDYLSKNPGSFVDGLIIDALDNTDKFNGTTAKQRELAVSLSIKSFISFFSAMEALHVATSNCESNTPRALTAWDGGAALLIGSIQGGVNGMDANFTKDGRLFYSISNMLCEHFDTCSESGSTVSENMLSLFTKGQGHIKDSSCPDAESVLESIVNLCSVTLTQSALFFADESSNEDNLAAGYVASMAVLPIVNEIDSDSASVIKKAMRFRSSSDMEDEASAVFGAFRAVLSNPLSTIDCSLISNIHQLCKIPDGPASINPNETSVISNGLYVATNYVTDRSSISLDVGSIEDKIKSGMKDQAIELYRNGANSPTYNGMGQLTGTRSISGFSTESSINMKANPVYNIFLFGLSDENREFKSKPVTNYADAFVIELLYSGNRPDELVSPNAMVVLNIWMQVVNKMYYAYHACKLNQISEGHLQDEGDASLFIDEAAAYWIGDSQDTGSSSQGHLLYALTEFVGELYEELPQGSQSSINTRIVDLFNQAKNHIAISKSCTTSVSSHLKLRSIIDELLSFMVVPLLRGLFYYLSIQDMAKIKLYAVSVLPLFSACSESTYIELKSDLIDGDSAGVDKDYIFSQIRSMYDCLGLTCDMVGYMPRNNFTYCDDSEISKEMAGYSFVANGDFVAERLKIDVRINSVEVIMNNGIDFPTEADDIFELGYDFYQTSQKSDRGVSISSLAKSTGKDVVPSFVSFRRYFEDDDNYADSIIANAFKQEGIFASANSDVRRRVISFTMRYMVTYMSILENLYTCLDQCNDSDKSSAIESLDAAAAFIIGSAEGKNDGGSYDGILLFMLSKRMCVHFGTCTSSNNSNSNERIISLLYAAQGEIDVGACESLAKTIRGIENALVIPLIQGTLYASLENDLYLNKLFDTKEYIPEGYVLALSILPLIHDVDQAAAAEIASVMVDGFPNSQDPTSANHAKVFRAMQVAIPKLKGVDCTMVGTLAGVSFCPGAVLAINSGNRFTAAYYIILIASTCSIFFICS